MDVISKTELEAGVRAILHLAESAGIRLPGILHEDPLHGVEDVVFNTVKAAVTTYPGVYFDEQRVRWKLRFRDQNGLLACGAVVEEFGQGRVRPRIRIVHRQWVAHSRGLTDHG